MANRLDILLEALASLNDDLPRSTHRLDELVRSTEEDRIELTDEVIAVSTLNTYLCIYTRIPFWILCFS